MQLFFCFAIVLKLTWMSSRRSTYLGPPKSNGSNTLMAYNKPKVGFFLYELIEKKTFYLSMLSDYTLVDIMPATVS